LRRFVAAAIAAGMTQRELDQVLKINPARLLAVD
jgi:predicted metal-dependent phosphotriesterase family hydrolase